MPLIGRIWELRHNFTAYDAAYIALAEATNSVLYAADQKLSRGHRARVVLFARTKSSPPVYRPLTTPAPLCHTHVSN